MPGPAHAVHGSDRISRNVYDSAGRLIESWDGVGTPLQRREAAWTYNANGRKLSLVDARGYKAEMKYDGFDRQQRWIFPSKTTPGVADQSDYEQYLYDSDGNRTSLRKRDGSVLAFHYDALNRVTVKAVPASATGASGYNVFYGYDLRGLQTFARFGSASGPGVANAYDGFGRLKSSTTNMDGVARTMSSHYDVAGNRIALSGDSGYHAPFDHDGLGRMTAYRGVVTIGYDKAGRRSSLVMGASTSSALYAYDGAGRLAGLTRELSGSANDLSLGFDYNPASQIAGETRSNDAYAWTGSVAVNRPYSVNGQNQYLSAGPATFAYDANGNLTSDGTTTFAYDAENRLVSASGAKNASLAYDPLGRLWQVSGPSGTTRFLYDGDRLVMEYDGAGNVLRSYVHGPGTDEPLAWYERSAGWALRYLHANHQGSIVAVADNYGNPVAINSYDEYGIPGANNQGRFQYTGQAWIPELGMYYYKARFYSPTLGRFLQTDPIGYDDQINLYAYVENDPVSKSDPDGTETADVIANLAEYGTYRAQMANARTPARREAVALQWRTNFRAKGNAAQYEADRASQESTRGLTRLYRHGNVPSQRQLENFAAHQGWSKSQTEKGPAKYSDENGVVRLTIKLGSARAPGSEGPHIEYRDAEGQRRDPITGNKTTRKAPGNHRSFRPRKR